MYEDRKSGRHLHELLKRRRVVTTPRLLADAMDVVVPWAELLLDPPAVAEPSGLSRQFATLKALQRLAEDAEKPPASVVEHATQAAAKRRSRSSIYSVRPPPSSPTTRRSSRRAAITTRRAPPRSGTTTW